MKLTTEQHEEIKRLERSNASLRGHLKRLKRQLAEAKAVKP